MEEKKLSRLRVKGRYMSILDLIEGVLTDYHSTRRNITDIAKSTGVSHTTVSKIINGKYYVELVTRSGNRRKVTFKWHSSQYFVYCVIPDEPFHLDYVKQLFKVFVP